MTAIRVSVGKFSSTLLDDQLDRAVHGERVRPRRVDHQRREHSGDYRSSRSLDWATGAPRVHPFFRPRRVN